MDYVISNFFATHQCDFITKIMQFFTLLGDDGYIYIMAALILLTFKETRKIAGGLIICLLLVLVINNIFLKEVIARPRPFETYPEFVDLAFKPLPTSYSFPSGHTLAAFSVATYFAFYFKKYSKTSISLFIFAFIMGFSRIYLLHHYFTDVLAGMLIGIAFGISAFFIQKYSIVSYKKILNKKKN